MQHLIKHLFKADSLEDVSRETLEELVQEYPSFSAGRYLLSRKLHAEGAADFAEETQKTNLYFTNPFWLQWLLRNAEKENGAISQWPAASPGAQENERMETGVEPAPGDPVFPAEEPVGMERAFTGEEPAVVLESGSVAAEELRNEETMWAGKEETRMEAEGRTEEVMEAEEIMTPEERIHPEEGVTVGEMTGREEVGNTDGMTSGERTEEQGMPKESSADQLLKSILEARSLRMSLRKINERISSQNEEAAGSPETGIVAGDHTMNGHDAVVENEHDAGVSGHDTVEQEHAVAEVEQPAVAEEPARAEEVVANMESDVAGGHDVVVNEHDAGVSGHDTVEHEHAVAEVEHPAVAEESAHVAEAVVAAPVVVTGGGEPIFQSFHTIDYFASQGIRLSLDENPGDRLGKQMKSFTDWLKIMKRLPQKNAVVVPDLVAEHQVQTIAAHSIESKEVLTETMAEVLVKQGMLEKATEVYHKLSLLNPGKSSYFAAKIEQLKQH